jgi:uncharacterized repeat protein (TIGR01451 family)
MLHHFKQAPKSSQLNGKKIVAHHRARLSGTARVVLESLENRRMLTGVLGSASAFAVLGGSTVTNTGSTTIVGDVGVSPGTAITGFPPGVVSGGTINAGDATATQAQTSLATAYAGLAGEAVDTSLTGQNLGGLTLTPGVYNFTTAAQLTGTLTLNAQGNPDAQFVIQVGTTLTTASNAAIVLSNGAQADNVYFQVGSSATLGSGTAFDGNILAHTSVTLDSGATLLQGRALAINGAVTLDANNVSVPDADVSVTNTASAGPVLAGDTITYTETIANAGPSAAQTVALSDVLPANTTFVSDAQTSGPTVTLTNPAVGATGTITGAIDTLASGASASFAVVVEVSPSTPNAATITNTADVSSVTLDPSTENNSATATTSVATSADVSVTNTAAPGPVVVGDTIFYTLTVANNGPSDAQSVALSDIVPTGTTFVSETQTSGPAFTLAHPSAGGTGTISDTIGTLASGASASFTVAVLVSHSTPDGATITDTANVSDATTDPNTANNSHAFVIGVDSTPTVASVLSPETTSSVRPTLRILGADLGTLGEAGLTYTWSVVDAPSGAKPLEFSVNGTNAARNATVRVQKDGTYQLHCVITNGIGHSVTAPVELIITQVATSLRLTPHAQTFARGASMQYGGTALDQFGHPMRTAPTLAFKVKSGSGTFNDHGMFTAGQTWGHVLIQISEDGLTGDLGATIV